MTQARLTWLVMLAACTSELDAEQLRDPNACKECHAEIYEQWSGSMHAYASDDPIFRAQHRRGQRETGGALGDLCLNCHAPLAVLDDVPGRLDDVELPPSRRGVGCFSCHAVQQDGHPSGYVLAGGIADPAEDAGHGVLYSSDLDGDVPSASAMCRPCHQRTDEEWSDSVFGKGAAALSCQRCHMQGQVAPIAEIEGVPVRRRHDHTMAGASVALGEWPEREAQRRAVEAELRAPISLQICVSPYPGGALATVSVENVGAAHRWPTSSTLSRRAWIEVVARRGDRVVFESGAVAEGERVVGRRRDPALWILRTRPLDELDQEVDMPWRAHHFDPQVLPAAITHDPSNPSFDHSVAKLYAITSTVPEQIAARVRLRPVGLDVIDKLVESGDLDPAIAAEVPSFELGGTVITWTTQDGYGCVPKR